MAQSLTRGKYSTGDNTGSIVRDVDKDTLLLERDTAPLMAFLEALSLEEKAIAPKIEWYEKTMGTPTTTLNGGVSAVATSIVVAAGAYTMFDIGSIIRVPSTGEMLYVSGGTSGAGGAITDTTLTVDRAFGETAAAIIADGATLQLLSYAGEEGDKAPDGRTLNPSAVYNYIQEFVDAVEATFIELGTDRYDLKHPQLVQMRKDVWTMYLESVERQFIWGERYQDLTTYGKPVRTTRGFRGFVYSENLVNFSSAFTKAKFDDVLRRAFLYGGKRKVCFAGSKLLNGIHTEILSNSQMQISPDTKKWGLDVKTYFSPYGEVAIVYHRMIDTMEANSGFIADLDCLKKKHMLKMRWRFDVGIKEYRGVKDVVEAAMGLMVRDPLRHVWMINA
jgi:hypothetical protein